ncbi:MobQ family relaxase [Paucisalibacillus globulus]|uniref:MobQ family relaxase n=1 Tax=Paucisalibacillus globulus TaxID=351095 RepID=UPI000BB8FC71|nr:MobQ family relaxase [Paucisalibacillus globulus]
MSTFYLSVSPISRKKGQSAVASAAYRSGENLYSELDMETKSYRKRTIAPETFIFAPKHAPEWVYNREKLWNEVEWIEKNANSRLAREVRVALPIELGYKTQRKMLEEFVQDNFVNDGMVADVSIHRDVEHNPHAHIMLTIRPFDENGEWIKQKSKKEYILDKEGNFVYNKKGNKKTRKIDLIGWDGNDKVITWRKNFAEKVNEYYKKFNVNERVSHESYEKQGLEKIPKYRLTRSEYKFEQREKEKAEQFGIEYVPKSHFAKENQNIEKVNHELEGLSKNISSLEEIRETIRVATIEELRSLRKNSQLSKEDLDSLKVIARRAQGHVDFSIAKDNLKRLDYWKLKLSNEKLEITSIGKTLKKAKFVYKDKPQDVLLYGFIPNKFEEQFSLRQQEYATKVEDYNKKVHAYNEINKHSKRAYVIQQSFTNEEFRFLYPDFADVLSNNDKAMALKSSYVDKFTKEGVLRIDIPELENNLEKYSDSYVKAEQLLKDWKDNVNSLVILERTKIKQQKEYAEYFKGWDAEKVFNSSVKYANTKEQIRARESNKNDLSIKIDNHLKVLYPSVNDNTLSKLPSKSKARILELCINGRNTGEFSKNLRIGEKDVRADLQQSPKSYSNNDHVNASKATGDIFSAIINTTAQKNEKNVNLSKYKDKKRRKARKHNFIRENEL